ncbi:MAG: Lrp/AsnC family leucine-responsive transcriptional regulator [Gammaproteobacteria bacterium]|jgi:Lrp/AsnC family leucine-responsive transcriptional regulator
MPRLKLDSLDRSILEALQQNARLSNVELADKVGLSPSPCLARVKNLTKKGVIKRHVTLLDAEKINLSINVFIQISLERQSESLLEKFEQTVTALPEVMECYLMTGDSDYLLRIAVEDINALRKFILNHLTRISGVSNIRSSLALKQIKYETALPLSRLDK